ncbi:MAG: zinc dependent phospholipase C family protein, partial [Planctomycetota bacterium]
SWKDCSGTVSWPASPVAMSLPPLLLLAIAGLAAAVLPWGPGSHLEFALRFYRGRRRRLPPALSRLLREERAAFLYGNIAADIINFKGYGGHYNHCHRWTIIPAMREAVSTPAEEAFVHGYLCHLAADTIAHNHFVPYHLTRYAHSKGLGHLYWEMRADRFVSESRWELISALKGDRRLDTLDELVNRAVPRKFLSMRANKLLFNHVLLISERDQWRRGVDRLHGRSNVPLAEDFLEIFRRAAVARMHLAMQPEGLEKLAHIDTNGKKAQGRAWRKRRRILRRFTGATGRRRESEEAAALFLEGMETPPIVPAGGAAPHW